MAALPSLSSASSAQQSTPVQRKGQIRQSASRWCYQSIPLEKLCAYGAEIGLKGIDLLNVEEWEMPQHYGLICSMGYAGGGDIASALNRVENHSKIEEAFRKNIPLAAKLGVPNVITFSGNRAGMSDAEGAKNTIAGLNRMKKIGEDNGVTICVEVLNSKVDHKDYMCDHGDLIATIQKNIDWLGHFHTGGVPHRHELDGTQEVQWDGVMRGIAATNYRGYVAHEFVPTHDPLTSLRQAVDLCDV